MDKTDSGNRQIDYFDKSGTTASTIAGMLAIKRVFLFTNHTQSTVTPSITIKLA